MKAPRCIAVLLLASALATSACGARVSPEERAAAIRAEDGTVVLRGDGSVAGSGGTGTGDTSGGTPVATPSSGGKAPGGVIGPTSGATNGSTSSSGSGATNGKPGWVDAPPGGNGGTTDVGVTATEIIVGNASDISGAVPGLFEDARFAVQAYFKYFEARYGTLFGRRIKVLALDTQMDSGANRSASLQICSDAFAGVGSVSAFDAGGASAIEGCKVPDIRGLSANDPMKAVSNAFSLQATGRGGVRSLGTFGWGAEKFPSAIKKAAYVYIDGDVTRQLVAQDIDGATKALGYTFVVEIPVGVTETNYAPAVSELKSKGAQYVAFVGAYQQAANLVKEFARQNYKPAVFQPTVNSYTPNFIKQAGAASEGSYISVAPSLREEIDGNPELQLYARWLQQVKPGAAPTATGQYAWGAAALFVEQMIKVGPKPTRKALLALLPGIHNFSSNGLFPGQDVGGRRLSDCTAVVVVKGGKFVRFEPQGVRALRCRDGIWNSKTQEVEAGFPKPS